MRKKQMKKVNRITRYVYLSAAILMMIFSISSIYNAVFSNNTSTKKVYTYDSSFKLLYDVNLIPDHVLIRDNIVNSDNIPMGRVYLTELIDNLEMTLDYNYKASTESHVDYTYKIVAVLKAYYTENGNEKEVLHKEDVLLETQAKSSDSDNINIHEALTLNLRDYINQKKLFEQTLGMNITTTIDFVFKVNLQTNVNGENLKVDYVPDIKIDLGSKTTEVTGNLTDNKTSNLESTESLNKEINAKTIAFNIIILLLGILMYRYIKTKTTVVNIMKNTYKLELNKMLRICQDKIVQVSSPLQIRGEELIEVKDFQEIIKLSEELGKPILCYISKQKEEALFAVITNGVLYRYVLEGDLKS